VQFHHSRSQTSSEEEMHEMELSDAAENQFFKNIKSM
jgi:hypothetical protein